jgi:transposase InsO family protein
MLSVLHSLFNQIAWVCRLLWERLIGRSAHAGGFRRSPAALPRHPGYRPPKPQWARTEVIRLKALMPEAGCRTIAHRFNRRFRVTRGMTVGKTYVADTVCRQQYLILEARQKPTHRIPRPVPRNLIWGLDLTVKADSTGTRHLILGILDHASRACLALRTVGEKSTLMVLRNLVTTCQPYGHPTYLRTDNEASLTTWRFSFWLWVLGIRHQRTDPHCPWQNGRVERFFGTLKGSLDQWHVDSREDLDQVLKQFRFFYNHARPHHHLRGRTPAEVWAGVDALADGFSRPERSEAWEGVLQEYYGTSG